MSDGQGKKRTVGISPVELSIVDQRRQLRLMLFSLKSEMWTKREGEIGEKIKP